MSKTETTWGRKLVRNITCPNCWKVFPTTGIKFIARHPECLGDDLAGVNEYQRFVPNRFTVHGEAIDPMGTITSEMACPECHLPIPETLLETPPLFVSTIGSPASGKSYFLAAMCWELRRMMPDALFHFSDADPTANSAIHEYEQTLFMSPDPHEPTEIRKTQRTDDALYRTVMQNGVVTRFPKPLMFSIRPMPEHPAYDSRRSVGKAVVLYDNAGEDFLPGSEDVGSSVVRHLAESKILFTVFDPTQDVRFREACETDSEQTRQDPRLEWATEGTLIRQETVIQEAAVRIRRYKGLSSGDRLNKPLIVIVSKSDIWDHLLDHPLDEEPYRNEPGQPFEVQVSRVDAVSSQVRELCRKHCPEFVASLESISTHVRYIPVSALGSSPEKLEVDGRTFFGIRPEAVSPKWVTVPLLYCLSQWATGMLDNDISQEDKA